MLSFIAELDEEGCAPPGQHGPISAAELYREIIGCWLAEEADRQQHRGGLASLDERERLAHAPRWPCGCGHRPRHDSGWPTCPPRSRPPDPAGRARLQRRAGQPLHRIRQAAGQHRRRRLCIRSPVDDGMAGRRGRRPSALPDGLFGEQPGTAARCSPCGRMSRLMADFFGDLAGRAAALRWAAVSCPSARTEGSQAERAGHPEPDRRQQPKKKKKKKKRPKIRGVRPGQCSRTWPE